MATPSGSDDPDALTPWELQVLARIGGDLADSDPRLADELSRRAAPRTLRWWPLSARAAGALIVALAVLVIAGALVPASWWATLGLVTTLVVVPWLLLAATENDGSDSIARPTGSPSIEGCGICAHDDSDRGHRSGGPAGRQQRTDGAAVPAGRRAALRAAAPRGPRARSTGDGPVADRMVKVPVQTIVLDVPPQGAITKDNVTLSVDAVVYFRVTDPVKAVVNVENYLGAISQVARTSLRSVIGRADLDTMLSDREQVNAELRAVIDTPTDDWGVSVDRVEIKDIALPEGMRRAMAHQAEAERDRRARVIAADGEFQASARLADAARVMGDPSGAMQLRLLQTVSEVASDQNSTLVMPLPVEVLRFFEQATGALAGAPARPRRRSVAVTPLPPVAAPPTLRWTPLPEPEHTDGDGAGR